MKTVHSIVAAACLSAVFASSVDAADVVEKQQALQQKQQQVVEKQKDLTQERQKESVERAQVLNKTMQQVSRASKIIGTHVANSKGENLGDIKDLVVDPNTGQVVYAVVSFGGLLGLGDKLFAVPWKALMWTSGKAYYILNEDKTTLAKAPGFDKKHWPDSSDKWDQLREEINQFYHVKP
jgi:sporulation protein YlmC with PRC-barrel domain